MLLLSLAAPPVVAQPPETKPAPAADEEDRPARSGEDAELDKDLFRRLTGDESAPAGGVDLLDRAVSTMRTVAEQIGQQKTGPPTRTLQQQILKDLDELIQQAQQPPPPSSPPPQGQPDQPPMGQPQQQRQQAEPQPQPQSTEPMPMPEPQENAPPQTERGQTKDEAEDSAEREGEAERRRVELARREQMIKDVWGHLPPSVRDRLLNIQSDTILPGYEEIARRYFEALAEDGTPE